MRKSIDFGVLVGKTLAKVTEKNNKITFLTSDNEKFVMYHNEKCCSKTYTASVLGDFNRIIGIPIIRAETIASTLNRKRLSIDIEAGHPERHPLAYYTLGINDNYRDEVVIRWFGERGYDFDSEQVFFEKLN